MERRDFLLEIDVEELPSGYVRPALEALQHAFLKEFKALRIGYGKTYLAGTANMLICYIKDVSAQQEEFSKEVLGPPKSIAFDNKGNPTKQALGFAKTQAVKIGDLKIKSTAKGEYIAVQKKIKSQPAGDILQEIIPRIIKGIHFPKTMKWDGSGLRFARPIESVLALFGNESLKIALDGIPQKNAGNITASQYLKRLRFIDSDERKKEIKRLISSLIKKLKADEAIDENLLEEITFMVNSPGAFAGEFDRKFLKLPGDVLKASMSKYQRVFPASKNGKLINKFIAVIDGRRDIKKVRRNYEYVLEAKLKDSLFFFEEDTKEPLSEKISQLKDLIFHKDLGNMFGKIARLKELCAFICDKIGDASLKTTCIRAAELSKTDLVTHMVGEFPSLQGIMGREYALKSGERKEIAVAIGEHYLPQGLNDELPKTDIGAILSISDKIDNLVGFLGIGSEVSGSFDPFGIRRNALGLIRIVKEKSLRLRIDELIQKAIELYGDKLKVKAGEFKAKALDYMKDRIDSLMGDVRPLELKKAVLESGPFDIANIFKRQEELVEISNERYFLEAAKVIERTGNILKGAKNIKIGKVDKNLFTEDLERELWDIYLKTKDRVQDLITKERYKDATREYAQAFFKVLHDFFNKVLVNAKKEAVRQNRLAIMKAINTLYTERVADLALIPQIVIE